AAEWERNFQSLVNYKKGEGDCLVPDRFKTVDGGKLGWWVGTQRNAYKNGKLSADRVKKLEEVSFVWDSLAAEWEENFQALLDYKKEEGNSLVPQKYKTVEGAYLGQWVGTQRKKKKR
ncbi:hypothetical protein TrLO_g12437, partial [Triparma laevis f. longispina]